MFISILNTLLSVLAITVFGIYLNFKKSWVFWKKINVPYAEPKFPSGSMNDMFAGKSHLGEIMQEIYNEMKGKAEDFCGIYMFNERTLLVLSPEFTKTILNKDFNNFVDHGLYLNEKDDPLCANLFFQSGQKWKNLRAKLTPTFSSAKLKTMFQTLLNVGHELVKFMENYCKASNEIEIYEILARFNTDVISSCAFGFEANSLAEPNNQFREMGRRMLKFGKFKTMKITFAKTFKKLAQLLGITFNDKDVAEFFIGVVRETIDQRAETGDKRNDFMQLLIGLMNKSKNSESLSFIEVAAQAYVFYFAGVIKFFTI